MEHFNAFEFIRELFSCSMQQKKYDQTWEKESALFELPIQLTKISEEKIMKGFKTFEFIREFYDKSHRRNLTCAYKHLTKIDFSDNKIINDNFTSTIMDLIDDRVSSYKSNYYSSEGRAAEIMKILEGDNENN